MANHIYKGEKLAFVGELKNGQTVTTDFSLVCQIFSLGQKVSETPCSIDTANNKYYGTIDTTKLVGQILIRFVARTASGDIIVSNDWVEFTILE